MERRAIAVYGTVQGVGFRPFVYDLASRLSLDGFVKNHAGAVQIEVEGQSSTLDQFLDQLKNAPPPLARIEEISWQTCSPSGAEGFAIHPSEMGEGPVAISPDVAVCRECLKEMRDPSNRRYRYPFINCTHCGPRLTIVQGAPYDRVRTTMNLFVMCHACRAEYEDPRDRRFHAQPIACPECGPQLAMLDADGRSISTPQPLESFAAAILAGKIGALKGLGGYHLICDATNIDAVGTLRQRKARDEKPLAIIVGGLEMARRCCDIDDAEVSLLSSPASPIVLLRKNANCQLTDLIAPQNPYLGVMLPYTPLHHLLMQIVKKPLVMTSGNRSDEPIAYEDADARQRLHGIADLFLSHNRPINIRCDDSVTRLVGGSESPIRRSRGYAPQPITLPINCAAPLLAVGGQLKSTFALAHDRRAILSHHMGDLDHFQAFCAFQRDITLYEQLFSLEPEYIAHDMHPDYVSTRYAQERGLRCIPVQHHHAHIASCMAENGCTERVIGVSFDGSGFGIDGAIWGGEFLVADFQKFRRAAHLRYIPLPGGEQAVRQPWRMGMAYLVDANANCDKFESRQSPLALRTVQTMCEKKLNSPSTSSVGRLFDAVASLCGVRDTVTYEGQAAMQLESLAAGAPADGIYSFGITSDMQIDLRPMIRQIVSDIDRNFQIVRIARRFHDTMAEMVLGVCQQIRVETGVPLVALTGGVFMNALLSLETDRRLKGAGFTVLRHRLVPPNDAGLCLGQLAIAATQLLN